MCGISGSIVNKAYVFAEAAVSRITILQHTRGPDKQAISKIPFPNGVLYFAHNRLKIIDLSDQANQPLWDASRQYCVTFNGEIYNYLELRQQLEYPFKTHSDTEVILNAFRRWGIECLHRFNGPFAFALYDSVSYQLYLCRDRFGKKPLFYCWHEGDFYFASSAAALAQELKLKPNLEYAARGIQYWVYEDETDISPYEGLQALPSGHYLKIDLTSQQYELRKYYDLRAAVAENTEKLAAQPPHDLMDQLADILYSAVQIRLRADVPLGVSLSGGLDSSTVSTLTAQAQSGLQGFTFGHPDNLATEGPLVKQFTETTAITPHYIAPDAETFSQALFHTLKAQEAPFVSLSVVAQFQVYQAAREHGLKVLLGGQGGDELFMGYRKFYMFYLRQLLHEKKYGQLFRVAFDFQKLLLAEFSKLKTFWRQRSRYQPNQKHSSIMDLPPARLNLALDLRTDTLLDRQIADVLRFSLPTLLRYEDRNSMGNSIESRLPFLDYRLVEFALALPTAVKLNKGYGKWILRDLMRHKIPDSIRLARYKRGFDVTLARYIQGGLGQVIRDTLNAHAINIKPYLNTPTEIDKLFQDALLIHNPKRLSEALTLLWLARL